MELCPSIVGALGVLVALGAGCASSQPDAAAGQWRTRLRNAMSVSVETRQERDRLSHVLVDAVEHDALEGLNLGEVQAAFGQGLSCADNSLCAEQGFTSDALYFPIGQVADDSIKQLPVLIVGFDGHGNIKRVYTLRTH